MKTRDCPPPQTSRFEAASGVDARELVQRLSALYRFRPFMFADSLKPAFGPRSAILPGNTALGDVLLATPAEFPNLPLGAVLLLSDGHSNEGLPPTQAAKQLRQQGIPVSVVGTGGVGRSGDVAVRFAPAPARSPAGRPLELNVCLRNTLPQKIATRLVLTEGGRQLQTRAVALRPGAAELTETFRVTPAHAGFKTYAVRVEHVSGDIRPETDVDYTGVEITDPVVFHVLYLGDRLGWEYKFLRMAAGANRQLSLAAAIRMAPDAWYHAGFDPGSEPKDFPRSADALNRFDAIVADASFLGRLNAPVRKTIRRFVSRRGGGCFASGRPTRCPRTFSRSCRFWSAASNSLLAAFPSCWSPGSFSEKTRTAS
ncbi:MAG: hypothetical protein GXP31_01105 [Kiritimatiellaeota bacterium]|nr:hypothetical protein [Kiritimatiellota bacterium]